jgi:hypothetical protein
MAALYLVLCAIAAVIIWVTYLVIAARTRQKNFELHVVYWKIALLATVPLSVSAVVVSLESGMLQSPRIRLSTPSPAALFSESRVMPWDKPCKCPRDWNALVTPKLRKEMAEWDNGDLVRRDTQDYEPGSWGYSINGDYASRDGVAYRISTAIEGDQVIIHVGSQCTSVMTGTSFTCPNPDGQIDGWYDYNTMAIDQNERGWAVQLYRNGEKPLWLRLRPI